MCVLGAQGKVQRVSGVIARCESIDDLLVVDRHIDIDDSPGDKDYETGNYSKLEDGMA